MLGNSSWEWDLPEVWLIHPVNCIGENWFSCTSGYQLQIAFRLGVGACVRLSLFLLGLHLAWTCEGLAHASTVSVSLYVHQSTGLLLTLSLNDKVHHLTFLPSQGPFQWWSLMSFWCKFSKLFLRVLSGYMFFETLARVHECWFQVLYMCPFVCWYSCYYVS